MHNTNGSFIWKRISEAEYATFVELLEPRICEVGGIYWHRVRSWFFRPLFALKEQDPQRIRVPQAAMLGGVQYAVPPGKDRNSFLNYIIFDRPREYSLDLLPVRKRQQVRAAAKEFAVREIADVEEFKQKAYTTYLDFYEHTRYRYGARRRRKSLFFRWADALFQIPNLLILGGYRSGELGGISVSFLVDDTLIDAMSFCNTAAKRLRLSGLLLHTVREAAAGCAGVSQIFAGMYHGNTSLDAYFFERGARILQKPAMLRLNPFARTILRTTRPKEYSRMLGILGADEIKWLLGNDAATQ